MNKQQDYRRSVFLFLLLLMAGVFYIARTVSCNKIEGIVELTKENIDFKMVAPPFRNLTPLMPSPPKKAASPKVDSVFICNSRTAYAFHEDYCGGLKKCKAGVSRIGKTEAESKGYKSCGYCYGKD